MGPENTGKNNVFVNPSLFYLLLQYKPKPSNKMKERYYIAWWNVENLFDVNNSPDRPAWLQQKLAGELAGWTKEVLKRKVQNLGKIIAMMNGGDGPDIIGLCEIENQNVFTWLLKNIPDINRNYKIVHHDMSDERGIDIAFIYDAEKFTFEESFNYVVLKRSATRDILQANFVTTSGNPLILIGNHWPARSGGEQETEPYRIIAAETMSYWMERIFEIRGSNIPVLVMGDFNDQPFNKSLSDYALSTSSRMKVLNSRSPRLLNLMWPFFGKIGGTYFFDNFPLILDQFLASKELLKKTGKIHLATDASDNYMVNIETIAPMVAMGDYLKPIFFSRPSEKGSFNANGYSDHFPVSVVLEE